MNQSARVEFPGCEDVRDRRNASACDFDASRGKWVEGNTTLHSSHAPDVDFTSNGTRRLRVAMQQFFGGAANALHQSTQSGIVVFDRFADAAEGCAFMLAGPTGRVIVLTLVLGVAWHFVRHLRRRL